MHYLIFAVLGMIQGIAEFLPISSSGHLSLFQHFFGLEQADMMLNILLHFSTMIAVWVYYYKDIWEMIREFFGWIGGLLTGKKNRGEAMPDGRRMVVLLILGTLPLVIVLLFKDAVERMCDRPVFVSLALIVTGTLLFFSDRMSKGRKDVKNATFRDAIFVGFAQALATVPGISRSGTTITAGLARGFDRGFAVRYSFLMSLPAIVGATLLEVVDVVKQPELLDLSMMPAYVVGMLVSGVVGYFAIGLINKLVTKGKFGVFSYYCWAAGAVFFILSLTGWTL